jgi:hypothetical protein
MRSNLARRKFVPGRNPGSFAGTNNLLNIYGHFAQATR